MPAAPSAPACGSHVQTATQHARNGFGNGRQQVQGRMCDGRQDCGGQSPDAQCIATGPSASVSARWCGSARRSTGRGRPTRQRARDRRPRSRSDRRAGRAPRRATDGRRRSSESQAMQRDRWPGRWASARRNPLSRVSTARSTPGTRSPAAPGAGHPRVGVQQPTVGRALGTGDVVAAGRHGGVGGRDAGNAGRHGSRSGRSGCPSTAAPAAAGIGRRRSAASRTTSTPRR